MADHQYRSHVAWDMYETGVRRSWALKRTADRLQVELNNAVNANAPQQVIRALTRRYHFARVRLQMQRLSNQHLATTGDNIDQFIQ